MNITTKSKYALRAVIHLARQENGVIRREDLASAQGGISAVYLEKILLRLREKNLVTAKSGPGGGYRLARPASEITAWDIIHAVEDSPEPVMCLGENTPACETDCDARPFWARVWNAAVHEMKKATLSSLAAAGQEGESALQDPEHNPDLAPCR